MTQIQCPNCGAGSNEITQQGNDCLCRYCGFTFDLANAVISQQQPSQNNPANDNSVVIKNINIGRVRKSRDGAILRSEKESRHSDSEATSVTITDFNESGGIIFHSEAEAAAVCKCGNLVSKDEYSRCSYCRKPLCGAHQRHTKDGEVYCGLHFWLSRMANALIFIIKIPFIVLGEILSLLLLKEKA